MILATGAPTVALSASQSLVFLLQVSIMVVVALAMGRLAMRIGLPAIVGELLTGVLLGPTVLGNTLPAVHTYLFPQQASQAGPLEAVGLLGVLMLVGLTGVQLDLKLVKRRGATAVRVSVAGLVIPLGIGIGVGFLAPTPFLGQGTDVVTFALFAGVALCVSAIPVISKTLADMNLLHRDVGQLTIAAGMVDDAAGWLLLSVVSAMATSQVVVGQLTLTALYLVGFVALMVLVGRPLVRFAMNRTNGKGSATAVAVVTILLSAAVTAALGLESAFGAFFGGILVGSAGPATMARLTGLRTVVMSVLAPLFMASAGLKMDLTVLADPTILLAALVALTVAVLGKFAGAYVGGRLSKLSHWECFALGTGMNARGVVEVIIAMAGLRLGVLNQASYTVIVLIAIVTSLMAPPLLRWSTARIEENAEERLRHTTFADADWADDRATATSN